MATVNPLLVGGRNVCAFLDMIAYSEIGPKLLAASDDGYNVVVGGTLFSGYVDHPRKLVTLSNGLKSTAAGRYQLLSRYFDIYKAQLRLKDFSPLSQDLIAVQQIRERKALPLISAGRIPEAIAQVSNIWASLPGAGYGQHENKAEALVVAYQNAGGSIA